MITLTAAIQLHRIHLQAKRRSPNTLLWYAEQFAAYQAWSAASGGADVLPTADEIEAFTAAEHARHKPATVHARFRALRALFGFLERRHKLAYADNPFHVIDAPSVPDELRRYVPVADLDRLVASITGYTWLDYRDRLVLLVLFFSGLRVSELCALRVADVDTEHLEIAVQSGKREAGRVVPTVPAIRAALSAYLWTRPNHTDILFLASDGYGGSIGPLHREGVRQMLKRRCAAADVAYYNPHSFRHGFAMWLLNAGVRATTVATAMGHSDVQITLAIYAHTTVATVRNEYDAAVGKIRR